MKVYYDKDADLSLIKAKKVCIVGYGSQGHAHALNLHESGVKVTVGLRKGGASWNKAKNAGLNVKEVGEAVRGADFVVLLMPDEHIAGVYKNDVEANLKKGATLAFAHGFNIHYGLVTPRAENSPATRDSAPASFSSNTAMICLIVVVLYTSIISDRPLPPGTIGNTFSVWSVTKSRNTRSFLREKASFSAPSTSAGFSMRRPTWP